MVAVVRGEMEVRGPKQHGRLRGFGNNVVIARYAPVRYDTAEEHRVVSAHSDGTISVWDGAYPHDLLHQFPAHDAMIRDLIIFWNDDRMVAASCTRDGDVKLWDLSDGTQLGAILAEAADHLAVSPNARWLATSDGEITQLWDLSTLDHVRTLPGGGMLSFSTDGRWLANTLDGKGIGVWDLMAYSE